jgi:hypothetical protein
VSPARPRRKGPRSELAKQSRNGIDAERRVVARLAADGYVVTRSPGSLGPADITACKLGQILFVQVKNMPWDSKGSHREQWFNGLWAAAQKGGGTAVIADWAVPPEPTAKGSPRTRPVLRYQRITGPHLAGTHDYAALVEPFSVDEVADAVVRSAAEVRRRLS